ncbi:MAG: Tex family protein [Bacillota bacterium]
MIAREAEIPGSKVEKTVRLLDEGNTVPFIARYRKEVTGELDEVQIRRVEELLKYHRNLQQRKEEVLRLIGEQGKLTDELRERITGVARVTEVEDLYRPFRPKRKTRAGAAKEKGLEPLADYLQSFPRSGSLEEAARGFLSGAVPSVEEALQGAADIVAERVADDPDTRGWVRNHTRKQGWLVSGASAENAESVYLMYYDYREPLKTVAPHRVMALNRGEREGFLKVSVEIDQEAIMDWLRRRYVVEGAVTTGWVVRAVADAYKRLVAPAVERDIRNLLTEAAEARAVDVFARNLRSLLLQPPVRNKVVMGIDPAYRTGCKWAVVDGTGKLLEVGVFYPTPPQKRVREAEQELGRVVGQYGVQVIAIGNGTASRETEQFVADFITELIRPKTPASVGGGFQRAVKSSMDSANIQRGLNPPLNEVSFNGARGQGDLAYTIVNEAGASVYSASGLAAREFPGLDVSERSAVSIARRLLDPLAELVKIEPRAVGVGLYQHDVASGLLNQSLTTVVESAVNYVGVDLNTASAPLLGYVAGINATVSENIVRYREEIGRFTDRRQLSKVPRLGPKTFEQCAGFLRVAEGVNPLDATPIHPESYDLAHRVLELLGAGPGEIGDQELRRRLGQLKVREVAAQLEAGAPTLQDIIESLARPGRDPRDELPPPLFRTDVLQIEDLKPGMVLKGTVRNVVDFGAFVDIGIKNDGLIHISELGDKYVKHPLDVLSVGDNVTVRVLSVDIGRSRIALSMKAVN